MGPIVMWEEGIHIYTLGVPNNYPKFIKEWNGMIRNVFKYGKIMELNYVVLFEHFKLNKWMERNWRWVILFGSNIEENKWNHFVTILLLDLLNPHKCVKTQELFRAPN